MNSCVRNLRKWPYSFLRFLLKKDAHSEQVFLLLTQNTADIPTISVIRYLMRNSESSGCSTSMLYKNQTEISRCESKCSGNEGWTRVSHGGSRGCCIPGSAGGSSCSPSGCGALVRTDNSPAAPAEAAGTGR